MRMGFRWLALVLSCLALQGCVVAAAADLAATTVLTAGKLVVKGTGALVDAAIPDKDDKDDKEDSEQESEQESEQ